MSVSSQTSRNRVTNQNKLCGRVLEKSFLKCNFFLLPWCLHAWHRSSTVFGVVFASETTDISIHGFCLCFIQTSFITKSLCWSSMYESIKYIDKSISVQYLTKILASVKTVCLWSYYTDSSIHAQFVGCALKSLQEVFVERKGSSTYQK